MCARCEDLEAEVAYLKSELGLRVDLEQRRRICTALKLRPAEGLFVLVLFNAKGRPLTKEQIEEALPALNDEEPRSYKLIHTYASRVRRVLGFDAIDTVWGQGLKMSPVGCSRVLAILNPVEAAA